MASGFFNARITINDSVPSGSNFVIYATVFDAAGVYSGFDVKINDTIYIDISNNPINNAFVSRYRVVGIQSQDVYDVTLEIAFIDSGDVPNPVDYVGQPAFISRSSDLKKLAWVVSDSVQQIPEYLQRYATDIESFDIIDKLQFIIDITGSSGLFTGISHIHFMEDSGFGVTGAATGVVEIRISGATGVGSQGATGLPGLQGETGVGLGPQGETGLSGETGPQGETGEQGFTGLAGLTGVSLEFIGTPDDGSYTGGLFDWTPTTRVPNAFENINDLLPYLAPANAASIQGVALTIENTTLYSGRLSAGNTNYEAGKGPGASVSSYIITDATFDFLTPASPATFNYADKGTLKAYINGVLKGTFDLGANFSEAHRAGSQIYPPATSIDGYITVTAVAWYNSFPLWQKGTAKINVTPSDLQQGYNYFTLVHDGLPTPQTSAQYSLFYDMGVTGPVAAYSSLTENTPVIRYLSGVKFYDRGSTFNLSGSASYVFDDTYHSTSPVVYSSTNSTLNTGNIDYNDGSVTGINNPPDITDTTMTIVDKIITTPASNIRSYNAVASLQARKPWASSAVVSGPSAGRLVDAYTVTSDALNEYFDDEDRRLYPDTYNTVPGTIQGVWDSSDPLSNGDAQVYGGQLIYPAINYTSGYLPTPQAVNYSAFSGNQVYYRAFYKAATPKSSGIYEILGILAADIASVGTGNINVEIKLPTQTGWLDLGRAFDSGTFTGVDGDGCRTAQSGSNWSWTSGTFSTANSGYMVIVRVTFRVSSKTINSIRETAW